MIISYNYYHVLLPCILTRPPTTVEWPTCGHYRQPLYKYHRQVTLYKGTTSPIGDHYTVYT